MTTMIRRLIQPICFGLLVVLAIGSSVSSQEPSSTVGRTNAEIVADAYRDGFAAFGKRDFPGAAVALKKAYEINPQDDMTAYFIAGAYALAGDKANAIDWLHRLAELKSCFSPSPKTFALIANTEEFKSALREVEASRPQVHNSTIAFIVPDKDLIPEGMGYDPIEKAFYLSSLRKRKIIKIIPGDNESKPKIKDFTTEAQDGLYCVLGIKIDAKRRVLWAISSAEPFMKGYTKEANGKAALFAYDLRTRKLIKKVAPSSDRPHLLNDLAVNANGDVFLTDTRSGEIFMLPHGQQELKVLIPAGKLEGPNGIALSNDGQKLFIASMGVYVLDLRSSQLTLLTYPRGISLAGIDGLYFYRNSLIGVLNIINGGRVARYYLNDSFDQVTRTEIVECNNPLFDDPTTGSIAGGWLYYIANSQYESAFNDKGAILPLDHLHDVVILKVKL